MKADINKPIIEVKNFTAVMGGEMIIDNISFEVNSGEIFVILGYCFRRNKKENSK